MQGNSGARKILFISEALSAPFDEGIKNVAISLHNQLKKKGEALSVTRKENYTGDFEIIRVCLNKLFLNYELKKIIGKYSPDIIIYLPQASISIYSFLRAKVLKLLGNLSKVVVIGLQHRDYSSLGAMIISNFLKPDLLLLAGRSDEDFFSRKGFVVDVLPPAVDTIEFCLVSDEVKMKLREKYNISQKTTVVLHVGHIKINRNIESLMEVQKLRDVQVVIVGSTSIAIENKLKDRLVENGIMVIDKYMPDISSVYKMSDVYVFPVVHNDEAIDMPLSVLEAMACNLPVITTRFGGVVDNFREGDGLRYYDTTDELVELIRTMDRKKILNYKNMEQFTWNKFTEKIIAACEGLA